MPKGGKYDRCVKHVTASATKSGETVTSDKATGGSGKINPHAICHKSLGKRARDR